MVLHQSDEGPSAKRPSRAAGRLIAPLSSQPNHSFADNCCHAYARYRVVYAVDAI